MNLKPSHSINDVLSKKRTKTFTRPRNTHVDILSLSSASSTSIISVSAAFTPVITENRLNSFAFESSQLMIPKQLLYSDYACTQPLLHINASGWRLSATFFLLLGQECRLLRSLNLDNATGVSVERLEPLRGNPSIASISLRNALPFCNLLSKLIATWSRITDIDISECPVESKSFHTIALQCSSLKKLSCRSCPGLTDFVLVDVVLLINNFYALQSIDFSKNHHFTDEGLLAILVAGYRCIRHMNVSDCKGLSTLSIVGLRRKMITLESVEMRDLAVSVSAFEWISEGCVNVKELDLSHILEIDDITLTLIGKKCKKIEKLIIMKCEKISDIGIVGFMTEFEGKLKLLDISGCILCGSDSALAISTRSSDMLDLRLNGLSQISSDSLKRL